jgi:4-amino-4-deoxy-L-arabinose transferase-like glycosyltransferase
MARRLLPWLLVGVAATVYTWKLGDTPTYISPDEAIIAVDAHALATTGRDVHGTLLPLYFYVHQPRSERTGWFTPVIFYLSAAVQTVLPFSEATVRVPSVLMGMAGLILLLMLSRAALGSEWLALMTTALLALSPAYFIFSRYGLDYLYPVPFLVAWALALHRALLSPTPRNLLVCGLCLGVAFYSYAAAVLLTPMLLVVSIAALWPSFDRPSRSALVAAGYALPLTLFAVWFAFHPDAFANTAQRYALYDASEMNALQGLREFLSYTNIERMVSIYWSFLSPGILFFSGDQLVTFSTRQAGVFPTIMGVLMVLGFVQIVDRDRSRFAWAMVAAFLLAPLPAVVVPEAGAVNRATAIMPFGALIAGYGLKWLWSFDVITHARAAATLAGGSTLVLGLGYGAWTLMSDGRLGGASLPLIALGVILAAFAALAPRGRQGAMLAVATVLIAAMQFSGFQRDYHGDYRVRVNSWLGGNLRGALSTIIDRCAAASCTRIYFAHLRSTGGVADIRNYFMDAYWRFYLIKSGRESLLDRSVAAEPGPIAGIPAGSLVLANHGDPVIGAMIASGELTTVASIEEMDREPFFMILEKRGS